MVYPELEKVFPFFGDLPERSRRRLLQGLRPRRAEEGEILNREGCCGSIPLVEEGVLRVYQVDDTGRELTLFRAQAGDACLLPLACGYLDGGLPVVVQAQEACRLLLIPEEMYEAELKDNPVWKDFVIGSLYRRLSQTVQVLEQTAFSGLDRRLARTLWRLSGGQEGRHPRAIGGGTGNGAGSGFPVVGGAAPARDPATGAGAAFYPGCGQAETAGGIVT